LLDQWREFPHADSLISSHDTYDFMIIDHAKISVLHRPQHEDKTSAHKGERPFTQ